MWRHEAARALRDVDNDAAAFRRLAQRGQKLRLIVGGIPGAKCLNDEPLEVRQHAARGAKLAREDAEDGD